MSGISYIIIPITTIYFRITPNKKPYPLNSNHHLLLPALVALVEASRFCHWGSSKCFMYVESNCIWPSMFGPFHLECLQTPPMLYHISQSHSFLTFLYSIPLYSALFTYPCSSGQLGCFNLLVLLNNTTVNMMHKYTF